MGSKTPIADRFINTSADGRFLGMNATQECADAFRRLESHLTDALNERHAKEWNSSGRSGGEQYAEMRDHARRLESALKVAEEALRGSALGARVTGMRKVADKLDECLRTIEKLKGGA